MLERAYLHLEPLNDMFLSKDIPVTSVPLKIGRKVSQKTSPEQDNGYFDAKVLSRTHAHLVLQNDQVMIQDVGSSNGTFINGTRLSEDGQQSNPCQLNSGDILEFGLDIKDESGQIVHKKVSCSVSISYGDTIVKKPKEESIDGLLQLVDAEYQSSTQASLALDTIRKNFERLEQDAISIKDKPDEKWHQELKHLKQQVDQVQQDLLVLKSHDFHGLMQDQLKEQNERISILTGQIEELREQQQSFERTRTELQELRVEQELQEKAAREQQDTIRELENQLNNLKEHSNLQRLENGRLNQQLITLREQVLQMTIEQEKMKQDPRLDAISLFDSKLVALDAKILTQNKSKSNYSSLYLSLAIGIVAIVVAIKL